MSLFYVYILFREDGRTPFYVGKGKGNRWLKHEKFCWKENSRKAYVIRKILAKQPSVLKIKAASNLTELQALLVEESLVQAYKRICDGGCLCNLSTTGRCNSGVVHTEEHKNKMSQRMTGKAHPMFGKQHSMEAKKRIGEKSRGRKLTTSQTETRRINALGNKANLGRKFTEEHKNKIRLGRLGKRHTMEVKERLRLVALSRKTQPMSGKLHTPEAKEKIRLAVLARKAHPDARESL